MRYVALVIVIPDPSEESGIQMPDNIEAGQTGNENMEDGWPGTARVDGVVS